MKPDTDIDPISTQLRAEEVRLRRRITLTLGIATGLALFLIGVTTWRVHEAQENLEEANVELTLVRAEITQVNDSIAVLEEYKSLLEKQVDILERNLQNENPETAEEVDKSIRDTMIANIFADQAAVRKASVSALLRERGSDPSVIPPLLDFASQRFEHSNRNGIYNTVFILTRIASEALLAHEDSVRIFLDKVEALERQDTNKLVDDVRTRLRDA